jgi:hypothetical protein
MIWAMAVHYGSHKGTSFFSVSLFLSLPLALIIFFRFGTGCYSLIGGLWIAKAPNAESRGGRKPQKRSTSKFLLRLLESVTNKLKEFPEVNFILNIFLI